ncbi:hypothetical protein HN587_05895 [Candidatus Woesearchaeota archaeon]|nr:hypothetical protein [Candidatus Woesearchaeota archaeon]
MVIIFSGGDTASIINIAKYQINNPENEISLKLLVGESNMGDSSQNIYQIPQKVLFSGENDQARINIINISKNTNANELLVDYLFVKLDSRKTTLYFDLLDSKLKKLTPTKKEKFQNKFSNHSKTINFPFYLSCLAKNQSVFLRITGFDLDVKLELAELDVLKECDLNNSEECEVYDEGSANGDCNAQFINQSINSQSITSTQKSIPSPKKTNTKSTNLNFSIISAPSKVFVNQSFTINISAQNFRDEDLIFSVYSYVFKSSKHYSQGKKTDNRKDLILPKFSNVSFTLNNSVIKAGMFKLRIVINSSNRKTPYLLTKELIVIPTNNSLNKLNNSLNLDQHIIDFKSKFPANFSKMNSSDSYRSSSAKARSLLVFIFILLFAVLLVLLIFKKL